ncbi:TadE/TadG family type IV pilus assembly protein [Agromyces mangrovi Wang et al. 2018]|uniref:TadE/TadG family type IV pilus assembly protein n=1 Tax=Agromyces mangrovi TaxID=1858653 RepID=UPI0025737140|nr:pilus assembly protein TadG-related protein [Agromyces mangrovi]BDZ65038.1 hypothetical protein GCM10025877_19760 [Agromyces mangrovi]
MRWLGFLGKRERGASAVLVGLMLVPLVGAGAIAVDVGALYAEKAQLQNGADAAALSVAAECAIDESTCAGPAGGIASTYANSNAVDALATALTPSINLSSNTVTVTTETFSEDGAMLRHPLAQMIGIPSSTVRAAATAEWGTPVVGSVIPLAIGQCEFALSPPQEGVANPTRILIQYDTVDRKECEDIFLSGGFGWLDTSTPCLAIVDVNDPWVGSDPGNSLASSGCDVDADIVPLLGTTILIPVYDEIQGTGQNGQFHISTFAAFHLTGFKFSGQNTYTDPLAPECKGNCRGLQGFFMKYVSVSDAFELGDGIDAGLTVVRLID